MCSDVGAAHATYDECPDAFRQIKSIFTQITRVYSVKWNGYPKGCFVQDAADYLYANSHSSNYRSKSYGQVCKSFAGKRVSVVYFYSDLNG